jgi:GntR family transcriptional regulator/MocR family aminotransferase
VDEGGLSVQALAASDAAVCYITPSHQFPTGVTMPAPRRAELLHWAAQQPRSRYIIEDDYDSEFRFDTRPLPSLQGMAGADGPVIYLSTCSRSLAPSIRIAYMVLPEHLLPRWRQTYALYSGTVSRFEQQTLARFINEGYFARLLARERVAYKARRTRLAEALRAAFAPEHTPKNSKLPLQPIQPIQISLSGLHTGLHLLLTVRGLPPQVTDVELARAARAEGVRVSPLSAYYAAQPDFAQPDFEKGNFPCTLVLGYGALADELCEEAAEALKIACTAAAEAASSR